MIEIESQIKAAAQKVDDYVLSTFAMPLPKSEAIANLRDSMKYSATNGGKRFRPVLSLLVAELFNCDEKKVMPFATAVEFIHTYSLIHDDLPCMDNDDVRRGKPTNHKAFGEAAALLAGDALLTESFLLVAKNFQDNGFLVSRLVELLSEAAGVRGMVGGQAIDLAAEAAGKKLSLEEMIQMHALKTGCMICVAVEGAAQIAGAKPTEIEALKVFGQRLGLAFQIADDILDHHEKGQEERSFVGLLGLEGTQEYLNHISADALQSLHKVSRTAHALEYLIHFNQTRKT